MPGDIKVSCIMPTKRDDDSTGIASYVSGSIAAGSWELILVLDHDAKDIPNDEEREEALEAGIQVLVGKPGDTLGQLRNKALLHARGEYIACTDDDDISNPARIPEQIRAMERARRYASVMPRITLRNEVRGTECVSFTYAWENTFVAKRKAVVDAGGWPSLSKGEDTPLVRRLDPIMVHIDPASYVYRYHGENTWDEAHFNGLMERSMRR